MWLLETGGETQLLCLSRAKASQDEPVRRREDKKHHSQGGVPSQSSSPSEGLLSIQVPGPTEEESQWTHQSISFLSEWNHENMCIMIYFKCNIERILIQQNLWLSRIH